MRIVVPVFHDEFKPPVSIHTVDNYENNCEEYIEIMKRIPKGINYQVRGHEIIKNPKKQTDDSEGYSPCLMDYTNKIILGD